jgi:hypothetical protein
MTKTLVLRGHVVGHTTVEVDAPIPHNTTEVQVVVHAPDKAAGNPKRIGDYLRGLPPGTRTKEEIDRQIADDRGSSDE